MGKRVVRYSEAFKMQVVSEALKKRIKELEKTVAETQVETVLHKAFYQIVCKEHGI